MLCLTQISDGARDQQSTYSVISSRTILVGSSRRGENKEERYVRRRVHEEAEDKSSGKRRVCEFLGEN